MKESKNKPENEPLLPQYNEQQYEASSGNYGQQEQGLNHAGPSNYREQLPQYGSVTDSSRRLRPSQIDNRGPQTLAEAFCTFVSKGLLTLTIVLSLGFFFMRFIRLEDLEQELSKVPQIDLNHFKVLGFSTNGLDVRVEGSTRNDYRIINGTARRGLVRGVARVLNSLSLGDSDLEIFFKQDVGEYAKAVDATVPSMKMALADNVTTEFNFVTTLSEFGSSHLMSTIVQKLLSAEPLTFRGVGDFTLTKGGISFGTFPIAVEQTLNNDNASSVELDLGEVYLNGDKKGVHVSTHISTEYQFPMVAYIPSLNWELRIPGCSDGDIYEDDELVTEGVTSAIYLEPFSAVNVSLHSVFSEIPRGLITSCGTGEKSPLDKFLTNYLSGESNSVVVKGSSHQQKDPELPPWLSAIIKDLKFAFELPGKEDEEMIKSLEFNNFRLQLPDANSVPRISAQVKAAIVPPSTVSIDSQLPLKVVETRGLADLYYEGARFAQVVIEEWVPCETTFRDDPDSYAAGYYEIDFDLERVPVNVVDQGVFNRVVRTVLFRGSVPVRIESLVDAKVDSPVGELTFKEIPASGETDLRA